MRTPPFSGDSAGQEVVVMQPPAESEEAHPAVVVTALEAYTDAPQSASCCSPAGSREPALAVTSISAYASAPASPEFDDTDCSMVNRQPLPPQTPLPVESTSSAGNPSAGPKPAIPDARLFNLTGNSDAGSINSSTSMSTSNTRGGFQKVSFVALCLCVLFLI